MLRRFVSPWLLLPLSLLAGCGSSSGPVLERIAEVAPPDSNLRAAVFLVRDVQSCAIGPPCSSSDLDECFTLSDGAGPRLAFRPDMVRFVPPGSPELAHAEHSGCFRLTMDDATHATLQESFAALRQQAFQHSDGEVNLNIRQYDVGPIVAGFKRWETKTGIFLQPSALEETGLSQVSRDTDFVFAVTGIDSGLGLMPKIEECAGTNSLDKGGFGGAGYTWLSASCAGPSTLLRHFLLQSHLALRDVVRFDDLYDRNYPACGRSGADPRRWFPFLLDCYLDPDSSSCGDTSCLAGDAALRFAVHVLGEHWPRGFDVVGNHCRNGRLDAAFGELSVDQGGVCDLLGR
jgi:hypothetical protein